MGRAEVQANAEATATVMRWIEETADELLKFLQAYVQRPSVNPGRSFEGDPSGTKACQEWLRDQLVEFGAFDEIDMWDGAPEEPNLVTAVRGGGGVGSSLLFNGHTDTFGVGLELREQWLGGDPWSGHIADGKMYGRGTTDMKAGIAAFLWAARALQATGLRPAADVIFSMTIGEETGEADIGPYSLLERGYHADLAVNAEGTDLKICPAAMGFFFFRITIEGKSLHPAGRHKSVYPRRQVAGFPPGIDAVEKMRKVMDALTHLERDWALYQQHPLMEPGNMNLCLVSIRGGDYRGAMPEQCEVVYAVVFNPELRGEGIMDQIRQTIEGVVQNDTWLRAHPPAIDFPFLHLIIEPVNVSVDHPATLTLASSFHEALHHEPEFSCMTGPGDANLLAGRGQPTIILGPGDLSFGVHGSNEYVPIQQVIDACKVYAAMIINWSGLTER